MNVDIVDHSQTTGSLHQGCLSPKSYVLVHRDQHKTKDPPMAHSLQPRKHATAWHLPACNMRVCQWATTTWRKKAHLGWAFSPSWLLGSVGCGGKI